LKVVEPDNKGKALTELIAVELYREGKITLRQMADVLDVTLRESLDTLSGHKTYLNYGEKELKEDVEYAFGG